MLGLAADAARATWPDDPMIHDLVYTPLTSEHEETPPSLNERTAAAYVPDSETATRGRRVSLEKLLAGCCTPAKPCPDHIDDVIEAWQDAQLDRHLEGGR